LIREPWRSIRNQDVENALGHEISAEVPHSSQIARLADSGLLRERLPDLSEFAQLRAFALSHLRGPR
jgi:hypothetical protein